MRLTEREGHLYPVSIVDNVGEPDTTVSALLDLLDKHVIPTFREKSLFVLGELTTPEAQPIKISHILPLKLSVVYDTYWRFAANRQEIFF